LLKTDKKSSFSKSKDNKRVVFSRCVNNVNNNLLNKTEEKKLFYKIYNNYVNKNLLINNNTNIHDTNDFIKNKINVYNLPFNKVNDDSLAYLNNNNDYFHFSNNNDILNFKNSYSRNNSQIFNNNISNNNLISNYDTNNGQNNNSNYNSFKKENLENNSMTANNSSSYITNNPDKTPIKSKNNKTNYINISTNVKCLDFNLNNNFTKSPKNILDKSQIFGKINLYKLNNNNLSNNKLNLNLNNLNNNSNSNRNNINNNNNIYLKNQKSVSSDCSFNTYYNNINENELIKTTRINNNENIFSDDLLKEKPEISEQKANYPNCNASTNTNFFIKKKKDVKFILI